MLLENRAKSAKTKIIKIVLIINSIYKYTKEQYIEFKNNFDNHVNTEVSE